MSRLFINSYHRNTFGATCISPQTAHLLHTFVPASGSSSTKRVSDLDLVLERRVTTTILPQDNVPGSSLVLGTVQHELGANDLDLTLGFKVLDLLVEAEGLPDLIEHGGNNKAVGLGDTHKLIEALWADVACSEGTDTRHDIVSAGFGIDGVGEVGRLKLVVGAGLTSNVQHARAEVNTINLFGSEFGQVDTNETSAAAGIQNLHGRSNEVVFLVTRSEMLKDGLGNKRRSLIFLAVDHVIVVGAGPVIIQLGHVLDVQVTVGTCQVWVVTMNVLIRVNRGCGGHDGYSCDGICCFGIQVVALEETVLWAVGAMEIYGRPRGCRNGGLLLWNDMSLRRVKVKHLSSYSVCDVNVWDEVNKTKEEVGSRA